MDQTDDAVLSFLMPGAMKAFPFAEAAQARAWIAAAQ